jgi:hypothetical protein
MKNNLFTLKLKNKSRLFIIGGILFLTLTVPSFSIEERVAQAATVYECTAADWYTIWNEAWFCSDSTAYVLLNGAEIPGSGTPCASHTPPATITSYHPKNSWLGKRNKCVWYTWCTNNPEPARGEWCYYISGYGACPTQTPFFAEKAFYYGVTCYDETRPDCAVNGVCGSSNGGPFAIAPTANLCLAGSASVVSGSGPWTWSCAGSGEGTVASCLANSSNPVPLVTLQANPITINQGESSTLTWSTVKATYCWGWSSDETWDSEKSSVGGSDIVAPASNTEYFIECWDENEDSSGIKTATINVNAPPCVPNCDNSGERCEGSYLGNCGQTCNGHISNGTCGVWGSCDCRSSKQERLCPCPTPARIETRDCIPENCPSGYREVMPW